MKYHTRDLWHIPNEQWQKLAKLAGKDPEGLGQIMTEIALDSIEMAEQYKIELVER